MEIFKYKNYEDYVQAQIDGNLKKIDRLVKTGNSYVQQGVITRIVAEKPEAKTVLCHGTRNANEQKFFKNALPDAFVIGSEISTNAEQFPMTVQHDFNKQRKEWVNSFDIVYSNSFDHSITPVETLEIWRDQLNDTGTLFLEHTMASRNHISDRTDPLKIEKAEIINIINQLNMTVLKELSGTNAGYVLVCEKV